MILNVRERLALLNILPQQGDITTIRIHHELTMVIALREGEEEKSGLVKKDFGNGQMTIEVTNNFESEFEFTNKQMQIVMETLQEMNKKKTLNLSHLSLWDKFCEG